MKKVILITGATDGLGRGVAARLAGQGHTVLVHGRDPERTKGVADAIGAGARPCVADLGSLAEVRRLADDVLREEDRLDVLVNNAATASRERRVSAEGHEMTFAVNYLSHFLLTRLLLPLLQRSTPSRIVNVSSVGQMPIVFDDVMLERKYSGVRAYSQSKLAQIMFTFDLARRLPDGVTVNALHPATLMDTKMVRQVFGKPLSAVEDGVVPTVRLAIAPECESVNGRYFDGDRESRAEQQAYDEEARARLWRLSEYLTSGIQI
jgi:NAD(P)-dependent dehydrogenase (short-subunit alcohol dehydrogenase family)